jgi:hypothetical protein
MAHSNIFIYFFEWYELMSKPLRSSQPLQLLRLTNFRLSFSSMVVDTQMI